MGVADYRKKIVEKIYKKIKPIQKPKPLTIMKDRSGQLPIRKK